MEKICTRAEAFSEVLAILNLLGEKYKAKVPQRLLEVLEVNSDKNYNPEYEIDDLNENCNISTRALSIIAIINLKYWVENEEEKKNWKKYIIITKLKKMRLS